MLMFECEYGEGHTFDAQVIKTGGTSYALAADWTPVAGDIKVSVDNGTPANINALPTYVANVGWRWVLSVAETTGKMTKILIKDQDGPAIQEQFFVVTTRDHPSAHRPDGVVFKGTCSSGTAAQFIMPAGGGISAIDDAYTGCTFEVTAGTGALVSWGQILDYIASTRTFITHIPASGSVPAQGRLSPVTLDNTSVIKLRSRLPLVGAPVAFSGGKIAASLDDTERGAAADKLIGRRINGGADGGRTIGSAFAAIRNKVTIEGSTLTVFDVDDTTILYTAVVTYVARNPLGSVDPA